MIKKIVKKIIYKEKVDSNSYIKYLKNKGVKIGKGTFIFDPRNTTIDIQRPFLLEIGEYCKITKGVTILTHDYSRSVLRYKYGEILGEAKKVIIGNNVFLGINSIILMGTQIGDNVIVGAGSVVSGKIPNDVVIAGNPAKIIMTLDEYYDKRKKSYINEAKMYAQELYNKTGRIPKIEMFQGFFPIFSERNIEYLEKNNLRIKLSGDDFEDIKEKFLQSTPVYENFEAFLKDAGIM